MVQAGSRLCPAFILAERVLGFQIQWNTRRLRLLQNCIKNYNTTPRTSQATVTTGHSWFVGLLATPKKKRKVNYPDFHRKVVHMYTLMLKLFIKRTRFKFSSFPVFSATHTKTKRDDNTATYSGKPFWKISCHCKQYTRTSGDLLALFWNKSRSIVGRWSAFDAAACSFVLKKSTWAGKTGVGVKFSVDLKYLKYFFNKNTFVFEKNL